MFRWCSYCQHLIGEVDPLDDYRISHGICGPCSQDLETDRPETDLLRVRLMFDMFVKASQRGSLADCEKVIDEALDFGLRPSDIIVGILHPALHRINELEARGEITAADEHLFTTFAHGLIDRLGCPYRVADRPLLVLANHPESLYEFGVRLSQILCWEHGIPCERIPAGTPGEALLDGAQEYSPAVFGLSVSRLESVPAAVELAGSIATRLPDTSEIIIMGKAFRRTENVQLPGPFTVIKNMDEFLGYLRWVKNRQCHARNSDDSTLTYRKR